MRPPPPNPGHGGRGGGDYGAAPAMGEGDTGWCIQATRGGAGVPVQGCGCEGAGVGERRVGVEKGGATEWTG